MSAFEEDAAATAEAVPDEVAEMFALDKKKKKKKSSKKTEDAAAGKEEGGDAGASVSSGGFGSAAGVLVEVDPPNYTYQDLLQRAVELLHQHNPEYTEKRKFSMKPPQLMKGKEINPCYANDRISPFSYVWFTIQSGRRRHCGSTFRRSAK
jgi:hypothetical protein